MFAAAIIRRLYAFARTDYGFAVRFCTVIWADMAESRNALEQVA